LILRKNVVNNCSNVKKHKYLFAFVEKITAVLARKLLVLDFKKNKKTARILF